MTDDFNDAELDALIQETKNIWQEMGTTEPASISMSALDDESTFAMDLASGTGGIVGGSSALADSLSLLGVGHSSFNVVNPSSLASRQLESLDLEAAGSLRYQSEVKRAVRSTFFTPKYGIDRNDRSRVNVEMPTSSHYLSSTSGLPLGSSLSGASDLQLRSPTKAANRSVRLHRRPQQTQTQLDSMDEDSTAVDLSTGTSTSLELSSGLSSVLTTGIGGVDDDHSIATATKLQLRKSGGQSALGRRQRVGGDDEDDSEKRRDERQRRIDKAIADLELDLESSAKKKKRKKEKQKSAATKSKTKTVHRSPVFTRKKSNTAQSTRSASRLYNASAIARVGTSGRPKTSTSRAQRHLDFNIRGDSQSETLFGGAKSKRSAEDEASSSVEAIPIPAKWPSPDSVDFAHKCWAPVNEALIHCGFPILVKETDAVLKAIPVSTTICDTLTHVLKKYDTLKKEKRELSLSIDAWKRKCEDSLLENKELKRELQSMQRNVSSTRQRLEEASESRRKVEASDKDRLDLSKQLAHAKEEIERKDSEIQALRRDTEKSIRNKDTAEKDAERLLVALEAAKQKTAELELSAKKAKKAAAAKAKDGSKQKSGSQQLDASERKKLHSEITSLRGDLRSLHSRLIGTQPIDAGSRSRRVKKAKQKKRRGVAGVHSANVAFTASSAPVSEDENLDSDDEYSDSKPSRRPPRRAMSPDTISSPKRKVRVTRHHQSAGRRHSSGSVRDFRDDFDEDSEIAVGRRGRKRHGASDRHTELGILEAETKEMARRIADLRFALKEKCEEISALEESNKGRPSKKEWLRLRRELSKMSKELKEAKAVADLRKYMDTRELIRRDKDIHKLQLEDMEHIPAQVLRELMTDVCRVLALRDVTKAVSAIRKAAKMAKSVPVLEGFIQKVVRAMLASEHCPTLARIHKTAPKLLFDEVIPTIEQWSVKLDKVSTLDAFRVNVSQILKSRRIGIAGTLLATDQTAVGGLMMAVGSVGGGEPLPMHEMLTHIRQLVQSEDYLLSARGTLAAANDALTADGTVTSETAAHALATRIVRHFQHMFDVKSMEGVFPKMNKVFVELNEMRNVMTTVKSMLGLEPTAQVNTCFKAIQTLVEDCAKGPVLDCESKSKASVSSKKAVSSESWVKWNGIVLELCELVHCSEDELLAKAKDVCAKCEEYESVFPRVQNLLNQLRATLGVEYAHEILPKVKQLCEQ